MIDHVSHAGFWGPTWHGTKQKSSDAAPEMERGNARLLAANAGLSIHLAGQSIPVQAGSV
jgi:hypothetical protein